MVGAIQGARESKVAQLEGASGGQQQVLRLNVPVHDLRARSDAFDF